MKILIIDNYDSFTFNLYQYIGEILERDNQKFHIDVYKNNKISLKKIKEKKYDKIIISPGPGNPKEEKYFGICNKVIKELGKNIPILGVCLGMQGIADSFGGKIEFAKMPMHGKTSSILHNGKGIFKNIPENVNVMRYHSLVVKATSDFNDVMDVIATSNDTGEIMGIEHKEFPIYGVQFHPESFASEGGMNLLSNFLYSEKSFEKENNEKKMKNNLNAKLESIKNIEEKEILKESQNEKKIVKKEEGHTEESAYNLQKKILNGEVNEEVLIKIFESMEKREVGIVTRDELKGFLRASREVMDKISFNKKTLDTCGTGGDGFNTFNISTAVSFVCAAAGVNVAKHGNRASSSKSGSADVLEVFGIDLEMSKDKAINMLNDINWTFLFAPKYHNSFRYVGSARKKYGKKTYFNLLGPLLNPVESKFQMVGATNKKDALLIGKTLIETGSKKVITLSSEIGIDEVSIEGKTSIFEFNEGQGVKVYKISPANFGMKEYPISNIIGGDKNKNAKILLDIFENNANEAARNVVALNSGIALYVIGNVNSTEEGVKKSLELIKSGKVKKKFIEILKYK